MSELKKSETEKQAGKVAGAETFETTQWLFRESQARLKPGVDRGHLNPEWAEWWMGWPMGWTALESLETDKFQRWFEEHGKS